MANLSLFRGDTWNLGLALQDADLVNPVVFNAHPIVAGALYLVNFPGISPAPSVQLSNRNQNEIIVTDGPNGKFTAIVSPENSLLIRRSDKQDVDVIELLYVTPTGVVDGSTAIITGLSSIADILPGATITGTGIPAAATVIAVLSTSSIQISANTTIAGSPTLTISGRETTFQKVKILNVADRSNP